jgi:hypothetical protein
MSHLSGWKRTPTNTQAHMSARLLALTHMHPCMHACTLAPHTHTHARARACMHVHLTPTHKRTHTPTRTRTHKPAHTCIHGRTHSPLRQWCEGGSERVGVCCPSFAPSLNWLPCILPTHLVLGVCCVLCAVCCVCLCGCACVGLCCRAFGARVHPFELVGVRERVRSKWRPERERWRDEVGA